MSEKDHKYINDFNKSWTCKKAQEEDHRIS